MICARGVKVEGSWWQCDLCQDISPVTSSLSSGFALSVVSDDSTVSCEKENVEEVSPLSDNENNKKDLSG